jgi:PHS family inorganic phosphate transporter-like MFS transporter
MLSTLFYMQAIGALLANVITVIITIILHDMNYIPADASTCNAQCIQTVDTMWRWIVGLGAIPPAIATVLRWCIPESPRYTMEVERNPEQANLDVQAYFPSSISRPEEPVAVTSGRAGRPRENSQLTTSTERRRSSGTTPTVTMKFGEAFEMADISLEEPAIPIPNHSPPQIELRKDTWSEFWSGLYTFLIVEKNWTDLAGTALSWLMLDFAFYTLSVNNPMILSKLWNTETATQTIYQLLLANGYRALIAVSTGACVGGGLFILMNRHRWYLQFYGFWILAGVFIIVGICFVTLVGTRYFAANIVLFSLGSLFFYFGPNTSTYVIAAEVFPTKYRSTCHGISAAAGRVGSLVAQIFLATARFGSPGVGINDPHSTWLGWVLFV